MVQCKGKTQNGTRCTREAVKGSVYCWQHKKNNQSPKKINSPKRSPHKSPNRKLSKSEEEQQRRYCSCLKKVHTTQPEINEYAICYESVGRVTNSCKNYK